MRGVSSSSGVLQCRGFLCGCFVSVCVFFLFFPGVFVLMRNCCMGCVSVVFCEWSNIMIGVECVVLWFCCCSDCGVSKFVSSWSGSVLSCCMRCCMDV